MLRKTFYFVVITIGTAMFFTGCRDHYNHSSEPIYGSGNIVKERRAIQECAGVLIKSTCDVILAQGDEQSIVVEADDNIIDEVFTRKENGILAVGLNDGEYSRIKVKVYVTLRSVQKLVIDGAGNISATEPFYSDNLMVVINGAGNIMINGDGNYLNCTVNGAGNIQADQYASKKVDAIVNGAGNCFVNATNELTASVYGVGSIYYYGNPPSLKTFVGGVGRVVKK
jgi:hypothetical protein